MEGLLNYVYYQTGAINQFDEIGHLLHFSIFEVGTGPCEAYNAGEYDPDGPGPDPAVPGVPNLDGSAATTDVTQANRCVAWLGDQQPGLSEDVPLPPYDPSVCPEGSANLELCDPAGSRFAADSARAGAGSARNRAGAGTGADGLPPRTDPTAPGGDGSAGGGSGTGGGTGGGSGTGTAPTAPAGEPGTGEAPDPGSIEGILDDAIGGVTGGLGRGADGPSSETAANEDLLGYLFGS